MTLFQRFGLVTPPAFSQNTDIFIAEGSNELRLILKHHLNKLGFQVRIAQDGRKALQDLTIKPADIVIAAADLAAVSGLELLQEIRENEALNRGAYILLTTPLKKEEIMLSLDMGVDDLIVKPLTLDDVLFKIQTAYNNFTNPKNPELLYEYAKLLFRKQDYKKAYEIYLALAEATEKAARPLVGLGRLHFQEKDYEQAIHFLNEGIKRNPYYVHAYALRAEIYLKNNELQKALEDIKAAIQLSPLNLLRYEQAADMFSKYEHYDACIALMNLGVDSGFHHPFLIERLGYFYVKKGEFDKAIDYLKKALAYDKTNTSYLNSLAVCHWSSHHYAQAIDTFNLILKQEPENTHALFNKALILFTIGKNDEGIKNLKRVLKIDPTHEKALKKLATFPTGS